MNINSKSSAFLPLTVILSAIVAAKVVWSIITVKYLPKYGINKEESIHLKPLYYRYSIASKKEKPKINSFRVKEEKAKESPKPDLITKFTLKGIIYSKKTQIITVSYFNKDAVLVPGDTFEGYKLKKVFPTYAIFTRDNKEYRLNLFDKKKEVKKESFIKQNPLLPPQQIKKQAIQKEGDTTIISKSLFDKYKNNLNEIQKNIALAPLYSGKKLTGFRVNYIKKGSDFDKLGLQKGDIIKAINGEELNSFEVPMRFFNNLDSLNAATITVQRGSQIKELEYEIH